MCVQCTLWLWDEIPLPCHSLLYTHNCLYYILSFCFFVYSLFVYLYIILYYMCPVLLLSFCCTIELMSRKQIPRMCKHSWPIKLILILKHRSCWVKVRAQERAVLNATTADLEHSFRERFFYTFFYIYKVLLWCKLYYFTQRNIRTRCQSAASAAVVSHDGNAFCLA